jgi:hypothetical protein
MCRIFIRGCTSSHFSSQVHSDSEGSVKSEDIMPSTYPVKPRKTPKPPLNGSAPPIPPPLSPGGGPATEEEEEYDEVSLEDTIEFLRTVEKTREGIFHAEKQRQELEILYQSLRDTFVSRVGQHGHREKGQENLLRALQGLCVRTLRLVSLLHRRNAVMCDVVKALRWKNLANMLLERAERYVPEFAVCALYAQIRSYICLRVCAILSKYVRSELPNEEDWSSVLHVNVKGSIQRLTLYLGMALDTPYGEGFIESIHPISERVCIRLPWGQMYCPIARLVSSHLEYRGLCACIAI